MEVIDFRGTQQVTHDGDTIVEVYSGSELMWKMATKLVGVYSRDEVNLEGLNRVEFTNGTAYLDGYFYLTFNFETRDSRIVKYIEVNDQFIELLDGEQNQNRYLMNVYISRFNKTQAEQLFGITIDDPDQIGMEIPDSMDIKAWY
ncbi:hypothetical protein ACWOBX_08390 [Facklamia languida]